MASDHPPVLFSARAAGEDRESAAASFTDGKTVACQLLHTLTATLNTPYALHQMTEVLGSQLRAEACIVLWHHRPMSSTAYDLW